MRNSSFRKLSHKAKSDQRPYFHGLMMFAFVLTLAAAGPPARAQAPIFLSGGTSFGLGNVRELVYKNEMGNDLLSRIVYPGVPSLGLYTTMDIPLGDVVRTSLRFDITGPLALGNTTDDDWLTISSDQAPEFHSDSMTRQTASYALTWGLDFLVYHDEVLSLKPGLRAEYRQLSFEAWDTNFHYPTQNPPYFSKFGQVLDYRVNFFIPSFGLVAGLTLGPVAVDLGLMFSPWLFAWDRDIHILTNTTYLDSASAGWMLSPELTFRIPLDQHFALTLHGVYQITRDSRGDTLSSNNGAGNFDAAYAKTIHTAGIDLERMSVDLGLTYTF